MKKALALIGLPALACVAIVTPADAGPSRGSATLVVSPAAAARTSAMQVGSPLVFSGCGYAPGYDVGVYVVSSASTTFYGASAGADGCFTTADVEAYVPAVVGAYKASAYQSSRKRADATVAFTVTR
jgi:hypothetical protein